MKTAVDTLLYPRWIIPVEPSNTVLKNHALALDKGRIVALLPCEEAEAKFTSQSAIQLPTHAVIPGLVNAHTHSPMTLFRGLADDLSLMTWLQDHIWPAERQWMSEEFIRAGTELALVEMIRCGTTCFNEHFFFPETIAEVTDQSGIRALIGGTIIKFPTPYAADETDHLEKALAFIPKGHHGLVKTSMAPHAPYTVSDTMFTRIKNIADQEQLKIHLHLQETKDEVDQSLKEFNCRPLRRLHNLGLVSDHLICVHMTQVNEEDLAILQETGAHVVHCPESNLKLSSGFCPVKKLLDAGINVALGTDGAASNNDLDMFAEMRTAAILAKAVSNDPTAVNAMQALTMATLNGARALGLEKEIGSLLPGKAADLIAIDLSSPNTQPVYNPISQVVYAANSHQVTDVWVAGKRLLMDGKLTTLDQGAVLAKAEEWRERIQRK